MKRTFLLLAMLALGVVLGGCAGREVQQLEPVTAPPRSVERYLQVTGLIPGGQAESKGVLLGDIVVSYDGKTIESTMELREAIKAASDKSEVFLVVNREGRETGIDLSPGPIGILLDTKSIVTRLPDAKIIEDIPPLTWESGEASSYIACVRRVLAHYGEQHTYTYLMGISGSAFRLHFWGGW